MKTIYQIFAISFLTCFANGQSMIGMNRPSSILKAGVSKCMEIYNNEELCTMFYDKKGFESEHTIFSSRFDSLGNVEHGFYGKVLFVYNSVGNLTEEQAYSAVDSVPYKTEKYYYDNNNRLIKSDIYNNYVNNEDVSVKKRYEYKDTLLIRSSFLSSSDSSVSHYEYDEHERVRLIRTIKKNHPNQITNVLYRGDTIVRITCNELDEEVYYTYLIKDSHNRIIERYVRNTVVGEFKEKYYYNKFGLLKKCIEIILNKDEINTTHYKYE